jgi:hypothetical protein
MRLPSNQRGTPIPSTPNHRQFIEDVKITLRTILLLKGIVML